MTGHPRICMYKTGNHILQAMIITHNMSFDHIVMIDFYNPSQVDPLIGSRVMHQIWGILL